MKTLLLLVMVGISISLQAQNPIQHMDVYVKSHSHDSLTFVQTDTTIVDGIDSLYKSITLREPQMFIVLNDTMDVQSFTVRLGTTLGGNEIYEGSFSYNNQGEMPDGTTYMRDGKHVHLYLGKYLSLSSYYAQVIATVGGTPQNAITFVGE